MLRIIPRACPGSKAFALHFLLLSQMSFVTQFRFIQSGQQLIPQILNLGAQELVDNVRDRVLVVQMEFGGAVPVGKGAVRRFGPGREGSRYDRDAFPGDEDFFRVMAKLNRDFLDDLRHHFRPDGNRAEYEQARVFKYPQRLFRNFRYRLKLQAFDSSLLTAEFDYFVAVFTNGLDALERNFMFVSHAVVHILGRHLFTFQFYNFGDGQVG